MTQFSLMLFSPWKCAISETFIGAHIDFLPFQVIARFGPQWCEEDQNGIRLWPRMWPLGRAGKKIAPNFNAWLYAIAMGRHLRKSRVNAVLAEYGTTGSYLVEACKKAKVPLFVHFHGFDASIFHVIEEYGDSYQSMFEYANGIVVVSNAMKKRLLLLGANENKLVLSPCGVDPKIFFGGKPSNSAPIFVAVGRFIEKKAPYLTILAFSKVLEGCAEARLVMIGDGPLLGPCKRLTKALGIEDSIELLGAQNPEIVKKLMRSARCFVQHSLEAENGDCEGTPLAIVEAQMTGLPVISTKHAGIPDVVVDGCTGYIVEENDTEKMSERMLELAINPVLAGNLGAAARKRAIDHFTLDIHIGKLATMVGESTNG